MEVQLSGSWKLSTEHPSSIYGIPLLVHCVDNQSFGPGDMVTMYPSYGPMRAAEGVSRLARTRAFTADERELIGLFVVLAVSGGVA